MGKNGPRSYVVFLKLSDQMSDQKRSTKMAKTRRGYGEDAFFRTSDGYWHYRLPVGNYANGKRKFKEFKGKNRKEIAARVDAYK